MVTREYLQSHALFAGVDDDAMADIIPLMLHETYTKGAYVVREGDPGSQMYFIRAGRVEVVKFSDTHAKELRLAILNEGDTFGEMELIDIQNRSASVRALENLTVLTLSNEDMYEIFERNQAAFIIILMNIAREISRRLRKMDALVASSLYSDPDPVAD
jgi:CRP/FNR family cyclic AMP-dependent transcriptional regulator